MVDAVFPFPGDKSRLSKWILDNETCERLETNFES